MINNNQEKDPQTLSLHYTCFQTAGDKLLAEQLATILQTARTELCAGQLAATVGSRLSIFQ